MTEPVEIANPVFDDREFVEGMLAQFPRRWAFGFAQKYKQLAQTSRREANLYLIEQADKRKQHPIGLGATDDEIQAAAKAKARLYRDRMAEAVTKELNWQGADQPIIGKDWESLYLEIEAELAPLGIQAPQQRKGATFESLCKRFADVAWWRRQLRVSVNRHVEHEAIKAGFVGYRSFYVSTETLQRRDQQNRRNRQLLELVEAENEAGYKATLAELSKKGVSNPDIRRGELMVRLRGLEELAKSRGLVCEWYTLTAPSRFHPTRTVKNGGKKFSVVNPKYDGSSPRQAQQYLAKVFARIRASLKRQDINPIGFRVAEPHKDACPHWHFLLFIEKGKADDLRATFRDYAYQEDSHELSSQAAKDARFLPKRINMENGGSAVGYISKYIAKNVSMDGLEDFDRDGKSAADGLARSVAWAAVWGIRQFQEIGHQRITQWREFRRIRNEQDLPAWVAPLWRAADTGEYAAFLKQIIKHQVELFKETHREKQLYRRAIVPDENGVFNQTDYVPRGTLIDGILNRYGEPAAGAVKGLLVDGVEIITRFFKWTFSYKREALPQATPRKGFLLGWAQPAPLGQV